MCILPQKQLTSIESVIELLNEVQDQITNVADISDSFAKRLCILFANGNEVIITHTGKNGLFEVVRINSKDADPIGYIPFNRLRNIIRHEANATDDLVEWYFNMYYSH